MKKWLSVLLLITLLFPTIRTEAKVVGTRPLVVILVEFANRKLTTTEAQWAKQYFSTNTKSLRHYYSDVSYKKLQIIPAKETAGKANDGIIKVKLSGQHPHFNDELDGAEYTVAQAVRAADRYVNYRHYDKNNNRRLETAELHIAVVLAGFEASIAKEGSKPSVWAHQSELYVDEFQLDGMTFGYNTYTMQGERSDDGMLDLGTVVHEFGHDLGLPDMYDTDGDYEGPGGHSLMATGADGYANDDAATGSSPTYLDPWSRMWLGWVTPLKTTSATLYAHQTGKYNLLRIETGVKGKYYLIENRQLTGYDAGLYMETANAGIAIWFIDETRFGDWSNINNDRKKPAISIIYAEGRDYPYFSYETKYTYRNTHFKLEILSETGRAMKVKVTK